MLRIIKPKKLKRGDLVRIIAPSESASLISEEIIEVAENRLKNFGLRVSYGKNIFKKMGYMAGSEQERAKDINEAFSNKEVKMVIAAIGGYTSNQLLPLIDYKNIIKNPKIFIGYSDVNALNNAIFEKTGLITFSGPMFATLGQKKPFNFEIESFKDILWGRKKRIVITASDKWAEDKWWKNPNKERNIKENKGWIIINEGITKGKIIGGNISTFSLLIGTEYMPDVKNKILFLEEEGIFSCGFIDRFLVQYKQSGIFKKVKGVVFGRFETRSKFSKNYITEKELFRRIFKEFNIPVIAGVDFGHTNPMITFPIGGECKIDTYSKTIVIKKSVL